MNHTILFILLTNIFNLNIQAGGAASSSMEFTCDNQNQTDQLLIHENTNYDSQSLTENSSNNSSSSLGNENNQSLLTLEASFSDITLSDIIQSRNINNKKQEAQLKRKGSFNQQTTTNKITAADTTKLYDTLIVNTSIDSTISFMPQVGQIFDQYATVLTQRNIPKKQERDIFAKRKLKIIGYKCYSTFTGYQHIIYIRYI